LDAIKKASELLCQHHRNSSIDIRSTRAECEDISLQDLVAEPAALLGVKLRTSLTLDVHRENSGGIKFYEENGFVKADERTSCEGDPKFRMIWRKQSKQ